MIFVIPWFKKKKGNCKTLFELITHPYLKRILFRATAILLSIYHYWPLKTHISKHSTSSDQASFIFQSICGTASSLKCPLYSVHLNSVTSGVILLWKSLTRSDAWFNADSLKSKWTSCENMQHLKWAFLFEARSVWAPQSHWLMILLYNHTHTHTHGEISLHFTPLPPHLFPLAEDTIPPWARCDFWQGFSWIKSCFFQSLSLFAKKVFYDRA